MRHVRGVLGGLIAMGLLLGGTVATRAEEKEPIKIDFDGLALRVARVPLAPDNYFGLVATKTSLIYARGGEFFLGRDSAEPNLAIYSLKDRKETTVAEKVEQYAVSLDGNKALVRQDNDLKLYDLASKGKEPAKPVSTAGLMVDRVPEQEWLEVFDEVWRRYRDFFYAPNMHGYDWKALREQYRPLAANGSA